MKLDLTRESMYCIRRDCNPWHACAGPNAYPTHRLTLTYRYLMQLHMFMQLCIPTLLSKEYFTLGAMIKRTKALYNCGLMFTLTCNKPRSSTIHSFEDIHPCWYTCTRRHATSAIYPWLYKLKHGLLS